MHYYKGARVTASGRTREGPERINREFWEEKRAFGGEYTTDAAK